MDSALADCRGACRGQRGRGDGAVYGTWLLSARAVSAQGRQGGGGEARRAAARDCGRPADDQRHWRVHGGRHWLDCVRAPCAARRWQREAHPGASVRRRRRPEQAGGQQALLAPCGRPGARRAAGRSEPGHDGARRDRVHAQEPGLRQVSLAARLQGAPLGQPGGLSARQGEEEGARRAGRRPRRRARRRRSLCHAAAAHGAPRRHVGVPQRRQAGRRRAGAGRARA